MKVFGIGMQRTGTASLVAALNILNIKSRHFPSELFYDINHPIIEEFAGFADNPIPLLYQELDKRHPSSRFIHTIRDESEWLESVRWLFGEGSKKFAWQHERHRDVIREMHTKLYGRTTFHETAFLEAYRAHNREVRAYFANRPNDVLTLDLTRGDGFEKLCSFLGKPMPGRSFPHRNPGKDLWADWVRRIFPGMR